MDVKEDGGNLIVTANYKLGNLDKAQWTINPSGEAVLDYTYNFSGVVDLMGICFDYPEDQVISKRWRERGPTVYGRTVFMARNTMSGKTTITTYSG